MPAITVYLDVVQRFDLNPSLILSNCSRALARGRMRAVGVHDQRGRVRLAGLCCGLV